MFYLSVKPSLVFRMTALQRKVLYFLCFFFFSPNCKCLVQWCCEYVHCQNTITGRRDKLLGMSCYTKLRIFNFYLLCAIFSTITPYIASGLYFDSTGTNVSLELYFRVISDSYVLWLLLCCFCFFPPPVCFKLLGLTSEKARDTASFAVAVLVIKEASCKLACSLFCRLLLSLSKEVELFSWAHPELIQPKLIMLSHAGYCWPGSFWWKSRKHTDQLHQWLTWEGVSPTGELWSWWWFGVFSRCSCISKVKTWPVGKLWNYVMSNICVSEPHGIM